MNDMKAVPLMLGLRESSQVFGLSYGTLRTMVNRGIIPSVRIGRKIFINSDVLKEYLNGAHEVSL